MKVIKNTFYNASYQLFVLLIPMITTPYLARVLGPQAIGINSYTNSIVQYFIIFGTLGVNLYGNRQIAFSRDNPKNMVQNFYEIFLMRFVTVMIAYILFLFFLFFTKSFFLYYVAQSISIIASAFDITWFFQGIENFKVIIVRNFFVKAITLIAIFTIVKSSHDLFAYIAILSLSLLLGNLTLFFNLKKYLIKINLRKLHIWRHLYSSLILFIPQIATQIYLIVNKTMLGSLSNVKEAGYFDQSDKIIKMLLAVVTATGIVMLPHMSNLFKKGDVKNIRKYLYICFEANTLISMPLSFGIIAISHTFVPLFFSKTFLPVVPLMMIESFIILMVSWSNIIGNQYLLPTKQNLKFNISVILGAMINVLLNIPLILIFKAIGTAIASLISEIVVTAYQFYSIRKQIQYKKLFKSQLKCFFSSLGMFLVVIFLNFHLSATWSNLLIEIIIGAFIFILLCLATKILLIKKIIMIFLSSL